MIVLTIFISVNVCNANNRIVQQRILKDHDHSLIISITIRPGFWVGGSFFFRALMNSEHRSFPLLFNLCQLRKWYYSIIKDLIIEGLWISLLST